MGSTAPNFADKTIWTGDNLDILRGMNSECVDLIYLDPPFNSNQNYAAPVGSKAAGAAFKDTWHLSDLDVAWMGLIADERPAMAHVLRTTGITHGKGMQSYLTMMAVRLLEMHRVLKVTGSIYLHCDDTATHYLKLLMDAVFGAGQFRNSIVWKRFNFHADAKRFGRVSDALLFYSKTDAYTFNRPRVSFSKAYIDAKFTHQDYDGRQFRLSDLNPPSGRGPVYEYHGVTKAWRYPTQKPLTKEKMLALEAEGRIYLKSTIPQRTDIEKPKPYHQNKHVLFGQQEGLCNGCKGDFPFKLYEVDHVVPKSRGGTDHLGNLQLLCGHCNKIKSDKPQEHLIAQLRELAYV